MNNIIPLPKINKSAMAQTKEQYLVAVKKFLVPEDYELLLCAIMDPSFIADNPDEDWLKDAVEEYMSLN